MYMIIRQSVVTLSLSENQNYQLLCFFVIAANAVITIAIRLRYDYDPTTTYRARLLPIRRKQKMNMSIFRRSRIVGLVESQLWYSLNTRKLGSKQTHGTIHYSLISVVWLCKLVSGLRLKPRLQLRFDCDTTTTRLRRKIDMLSFCSRRMEAGARDTS